MKIRINGTKSSVEIMPISTVAAIAIEVRGWKKS